MAHLNQIRRTLSPFMHTSEVVNKKRGVLMSWGHRCRRVHEDTISTEQMVQQILFSLDICF